MYGYFSIIMHGWVFNKDVGVCRSLMGGAEATKENPSA